MDHCMFTWTYAFILLCPIRYTTIIKKQKALIKSLETQNNETLELNHSILAKHNISANESVLSKEPKSKHSKLLAKYNGL